MRCDEFQQRWQVLLDERRSPQDDEILCSHADLCEDCSELLRVQTLLFRELKRSKNAAGLRSQPGRVRVAQAAADTALNARHQSGLGTNSRARRPVVNSVFIGLAVAASLLVILLPAWRHATTRDTGARSNSRVALSGRRSLPATVWVAKTPPVSRPKTAQIADSQPAGLTAEQEALRKLMQDMAAKLSDVPEGQLEPLDRIAGGFRPLANTLGVAWDALRRTIPVGRSQAVQDPQAVLGWPGIQASPA